MRRRLGGWRLGTECYCQRGSSNSDPRVDNSKYSISLIVWPAAARFIFNIVIIGLPARESSELCAWHALLPPWLVITSSSVPTNFNGAYQYRQFMFVNHSMLVDGDRIIAIPIVHPWHCADKPTYPSPNRINSNNVT